MTHDLTRPKRALSIVAMSARMHTVDLLGMQIASIDMDQLFDHLFKELAAGRGGWLITANLDFLRRHVHDDRARRMYEHADLRVADGMPLIWASHLRGTPLPERVAGSSMLRPLCERAVRNERTVYFLGGDPKANEAAADRLTREIPGLRVVGRSAPFISKIPTEAELLPIREELSRTRPDFVLVAFGSPKQEELIHALRAEFPNTWWIGIGISFSFIAGHVKRAPPLVQQLGLEWAHRLVQEPERLFRRYVIEDIPFAFTLFGRVARERVRDKLGA